MFTNKSSFLCHVAFSDLYASLVIMVLFVPSNAAKNLTHSLAFQHFMQTFPKRNGI